MAPGPGACEDVDHSVKYRERVFSKRFKFGTMQSVPTPDSRVEGRGRPQAALAWESPRLRGSLTIAYGCEGPQSPSQSRDNRRKGGRGGRNRLCSICIRLEAGNFWPQRGGGCRKIQICHENNLSRYVLVIECCDSGSLSGQMARSIFGTSISAHRFNFFHPYCPQEKLTSFWE